ncbi:MAG: GspMb/PilO family protein [Prosthecobacter sp.]
MALALTPREKKLLLACIGSLVLVGGMLGANDFLNRRREALARIASLETELAELKMLFEDREFWNKRAKWLRETMPATESLGQAQAKLLEDVQNDALDLTLKVEQQRLLEPVSNENYREVAVEVRLRGDQTTLLGWMAGLQSPERFQAIKALEFEIDSRAKEKTPQAICELTLARWFKPEAGL